MRSSRVYNMRTSSLERLHKSAVERFIESPGFGFARMPPPGNDYLEDHDDPPVPQLASVADDTSSEPAAASPSESVTDKSAARELAALPTAIEAWNMHKAGLQDFLDPKRFGLIRDREQVAGFLSHRLSQRGRDESFSYLPSPARLELVSLLKFTEPRVYISENLPRMDELKDAGTRQLDAFEQRALADLRKGEDIFTGVGPHSWRALGALRVLKSCLQCHTATEGELLGAFSYSWPRRLSQPPPPPDDTPST